MCLRGGSNCRLPRTTFDTLRANTSLLADLLEKADFDALVYLSSARIYRHAEHTGEEAAIFVRPGDPEDLYDLTKLAGEALCNASNRSNVRVVRLTNVVGPDFTSKNFLIDLIRNACDDGEVNLHTAPQSEKDYVRLEDVLDLMPQIVISGRHTCYNFGSGRNLSHSELRRHHRCMLRCPIEYRDVCAASCLPTSQYRETARRVRL